MAKKKLNPYAFRPDAKEPKLLENLAKVAAKLDRSVNWCINQAIKQFIESNKK